MVNVTVASEIISVGEGDIEYGEQSNEDGVVDRYQCMGCGYILSDISDSEALYDFLQGSSRRIELDAYNIVIEIEGNGGTITSDLHESCPYCDQIHCVNDCDQSQYDSTQETEEDACKRGQFNAAMDGIESFVLAQACAGVDITTPAFICALETAFESCANRYS